MVRRADHVVILPGAYRAWERSSPMPGRLDEIVDRVLALPDDRVNVRRVVPHRDVRCITAILGGWQVRVIGEVDEQGRWCRVQDVHAQESE